MLSGFRIDFSHTNQPSTKHGYCHRGVLRKHTTIVLVSKWRPIFRSITLCNVCYKIIVKVVTIRLKTCIQISAYPFLIYVMFIIRQRKKDRL